MKKLLSVLLCILLTMQLCVLASAAGTVYYIDSVSGSDANSGLSENAAWQSAAKLRGLALNPGDQVLFKRGGTYPCTLELNCSGTKEAPIVISAYGFGERPLLTTDQHTEVLTLTDCSYVTVSGLEITAHNGGGIWINTEKKESDGITVTDMKIHDIQNYKVTSRDSQSRPRDARACMMVKCLAYPSPSLYRVNNLTVTDCEMYDCGNGLLLWGAFAPESHSPWAETDNDVTLIYNQNTYVADCYFHDMDAEAMIIGQTENAWVTRCRAIDCCQGEGVDENGERLYYTAPMWFWGGLNSTVDHCEIAGARNVGDGMAVDFDSWTNGCTYQYVYSHDNTCFVCNCPYGNEGQHNNTVRYCLSVNDNHGKKRNEVGGNDDHGEQGLRFYNNTIINCNDFTFDGTQNSLFANNIIIPVEGHWVTTGSDNIGNTFTGNCFYNCLSPLCDFFARNTDPCFAVGSYELSAKSPLLGKGIKIEDGLTEDFFGNPLTQNNIGCYAGEGAPGVCTREMPLQKIVRLVREAFLYIVRYFREEVFD